MALKYVQLHYIAYYPTCVFYICRVPTGNFTYCLHKVNSTLKFLYSVKIVNISFGDININYRIDILMHC